MKNIYKPFTLLLLFFFVALVFKTSYAQCPNGEPNATTVYNTTIATPAAFYINKLPHNKAELKWVDDDYTRFGYSCEAEVNRNGNNFSSIGSLLKHTKSNEPYKLSYTATDRETGIYYFRIKQVCSNGYVHYSNIKQVRLGNSEAEKFWFIQSLQRALLVSNLIIV